MMNPLSEMFNGFKINLILLVVVMAFMMTGCASALLETIQEEAINLDAKTLEWVSKNRDRVCAKALLDPYVLTALNEGIAQKLIHPEFCEVQE